MAITAILWVGACDIPMSSKGCLYIPNPLSIGLDAILRGFEMTIAMGRAGADPAGTEKDPLL